MLTRKKGEGKPLPETADMKMWREEFKEMKIEDHQKVLKNLGLDDEDIEEFKQAEKGGKKLEDILGVGEDGDGTEAGEKPFAEKSRGKPEQKPKKK